MRPVFIIAIAAVAMIGVMVPSDEERKAKMKEHTLRSKNMARC